MSCQDISQMLPWYLNSTLTSEERQQVDAHLQSCAQCRQELADTLWVARARTLHPSSKILVDFAFDREVPHHDAVREHLQHCPDCSDHLSLVRQSRQTEDIAVIHPGSRRTASGVPARRWRSIAVAAMLASVVGFGGWIQEKMKPDEPIGIFSLTELASDSLITRSATSPDNVVFLTEGEDQVLIRCSGPARAGEFSTFTAELLRGEQEIWSDLEVRPDPLGDFHVLQSTADLEPGQEHSVKIYGISEGGSEALDSCSFTVEEKRQ